MTILSKVSFDLFREVRQSNGIVDEDGYGSNETKKTYPKTQTNIRCFSPLKAYVKARVKSRLIKMK